MTRLYGMVEELRAAGRDATIIELSADDEATLRTSASHAFGEAGAIAAAAGTDIWRSFFSTHLRKIVGLRIEFDATETCVR
jgi:hypothetical protein